MVRVGPLVRKLHFFAPRRAVEVEDGVQPLSEGLTSEGGHRRVEAIHGIAELRITAEQQAALQSAGRRLKNALITSDKPLSSVRLWGSQCRAQ